MENLFSTLFPDDLFGEPYQSYDEYLEDLRKKAELILIQYVSVAFTTDHPLDKFRGVVVDIKQVQKIFYHNKKLEYLSATVASQLQQADFFINSRLEVSTSLSFFAFDYICKLYRLSECEILGLILHLMPYIDKRYEKLFGYMRDDITLKYPDTELILKLYYFAQSGADIEHYYEKLQNTQRRFQKLLLIDNTLDSRIIGFILSNGEEDLTLEGIEVYIPIKSEALIIHEDVAQKLCDITHDCGKHIHIYGENGNGKRTLVRRFSQIEDRPIIFVDGKLEDWNIFLIASREAAINGAALCIHNTDNCAFIDRIIQQAFTDTVFVLGENKYLNCEMFFTQIEIPTLTKSESILIWQTYMKAVHMKEPTEAFELANKFTFSIDQISRTTADAQSMSKLYPEGLTKRQLNTCAYRQIENKLGDLCTLIPAKHTWDQLVLAPEQKEMLKNACDQIRYKHIVYDEWGFNERIAYGRGVSMLFEGPPGTGKTMAAQVVANELAIDIYKVDLSQIVSKYIGETEKNLSNLFEQAKKSNVILFFDETDAILGKRTEVKDSHDRNANLETAYLLQKMEEYDGITVMTTNYLENIDPAFFRRISYVIHFPFPDSKSRLKIWQGIYPANVPLEDNIDMEYLANQFDISGGNIKNIALTSSFLAVKDSGIVSMKHILKAIKYELTKQKKVILKEDFGEYGFLL